MKLVEDCPHRPMKLRGSILLLLSSLGLCVSFVGI